MSRNKTSCPIQLNFFKEYAKLLPLIVTSARPFLWGVEADDWDVSKIGLRMPSHLPGRTALNFFILAFKCAHEKKSDILV